MTESPTTTEPKRKRRWFQYSLRTFFVLMTAVCIWLGWLTSQARQQRAAVAWVEEMGGTVTYDYELDEDDRFKYDVEPPEPKWLRETLGIDFMANVVDVNLDGTQVSDVKPLAALKNLQWLGLEGTPVSDVTTLAGLKNLQELYLVRTPVSDVTPLAGLKNLQLLGLTGTRVNDLTPLGGLKNLQSLSLTSTRVNDLTPLAGLKNLQSLSVNGTQVSEEQVTRLRRALPNCTIYWEPED